VVELRHETGRDIAQSNRGVPIEIVTEMLDHVRAAAPLHALDAELALQPLSRARRLACRRLGGAAGTGNPQGKQVLGITRLTGGSQAARVLQQGDLLLAVEGKPVHAFRDVERAVADKPLVKVTVWRGTTEQVLDVDTSRLGGVDVERVVQWQARLCRRRIAR